MAKKTTALNLELSMSTLAEAISTLLAESSDKAQAQVLLEVISLAPDPEVLNSLLGIESEKKPSKPAKATKPAKETQDDGEDQDPLAFLEDLEIDELLPVAQGLAGSARSKKALAKLDKDDLIDAIYEMDEDAVLGAFNADADADDLDFLEDFAEEQLREIVLEIKATSKSKAKKASEDDLRGMLYDFEDPSEVLAASADYLDEGAADAEEYDEMSDDALIALIVERAIKNEKGKKFSAKTLAAYDTDDLIEVLEEDDDE